MNKRRTLDAALDRIGWDKKDRKIIREKLAAIKAERRDLATVSILYWFDRGVVGRNLERKVRLLIRGGAA